MSDLREPRRRLGTPLQQLSQPDNRWYEWQVRERRRQHRLELLVDVLLWAVFVAVVWFLVWLGARAI